VGGWSGLRVIDVSDPANPVLRGGYDTYYAQGVFVSGSLAYDRIMDFPGHFSDHILPDKIHTLNVCFQVNGLTAETLAKAIANPDDYRDLIVRIGGFSDYFNNLSLDVRREMAERLQQGV
jgi:hypothetical protein